MFHVNPETGNPGKCSAKKGNCPYGEDAPHFNSRVEAREYFEATNAGETITTLKKTIVLSDIDGTLVKSSLVLENAVELHQNGEVDLGDLPDRWLADMKNEELITELATSYRDSLIGKQLDFVKVERTLNRMLENDSNFFSTLNELVEHKKNGADVVLISGSPEFLVKPFAEKYGFKYHASVYHQDESGAFTGDITLMAGGEAKQKVIESLNIEEYDHVIGVGDTASDGPLLKAAHHSILVAPTEETVETLKKLQVRVDKVVFD